MPLGTKLRRGLEIPFSEQDAVGAEFETDTEGDAADDDGADDDALLASPGAGAAAKGTPRSGQKQQQQQQGVGGVRGDDSDFELGSDDEGQQSEDEVGGWIVWCGALEGVEGCGRVGESATTQMCCTCPQCMLCTVVVPTDSHVVVPCVWWMFVQTNLCVPFACPPPYPLAAGA